MASTKKPLARLQRAMDEQRLVRIDRNLKHADRLTGFVVGIGAAWVLLRKTSDGGYFDGTAAIRLRDVMRVSKDRSFEGEFARTRPEWPPTVLGDIGLDSVEQVLKGFATSHRLVGIQREQTREAIWIGTFVAIEDERAYLHEVRPDATWHAEPLGYKLKAITCVEAGGQYMTALEAIAGSVPPTSSNE